MEMAKANKMKKANELRQFYNNQVKTKEKTGEKKYQQEINIEKRMIDDARRKLESEQRRKKEKMDNFKTEVQESVNALMEKKQLEKERAEKEKENVRNMALQNEKIAQMKDMNYKKYYQNIEDKFKSRENLFLQNHLAPTFERSKKIDDFIDKSIENRNKKLQDDHKFKIENKSCQKQELQEYLKSQLKEKEDYLKAEDNKYNQEQKDRLKMERDYKKYILQEKSKKKEDMAVYKSDLTVQTLEKDPEFFTGPTVEDKKKNLQLNNGNNVNSPF